MHIINVLVRKHLYQTNLVVWLITKFYIIAGNIIKGLRFRVKSKCCVLEPNLVSVPNPVSLGSDESSIKSSHCWIDESEFEIQSDEHQETVEQDEVVYFTGPPEQMLVGVAAGNDSFSTYNATSNTDIQNFFRRPVKIDSYTWLEADTVGIKQTIYPWHLWANTTSVKNKLNNYSWFRGDLHLKFVISASPFYYGLTKVTYLPSHVHKGENIVADAATRYFIPYSQRPHVDLDPHNCSPISMKLPFIWHQNFINVQSASSITELGKLVYLIYADLNSANGAVGTGITVTTYAWCDNITLSGASVGFAMQSDEFTYQSDEYGEGCISAPASRVASAASYFENIPIIGPFATATKIGASAVSSIAKLFGYTNVPVIEDSHPQRPEAFPKMSSSEIGFPIEKLTLDPKNELSIDPRIVGLDSGSDEMCINHIASRNSLLARCTWATTDAVDAMLFSCRVNPKLYDADALTQSKVYLTPMSFIANMFNHWRGDIIFNIKVVSSMYHKGKLKVSFDPTGDATYNLINQTATTNLVQTAIMDLETSRELDFLIPYQARSQFLQVRTALSEAEKGWAVNAAGTFNADRNYDNGTFTIRVNNILTAPIASSTMTILISVRAGNNFELANPTDVDITSRLSPFVPQSDEFDSSPPKEVVLGKKTLCPDNQYAVHFGENIRSIRQLLRRTELHSSMTFNLPTDATHTVCQPYFRFFKMPTSPGFQTDGLYNANQIVGAGTSKYNYCEYTALAYFSQAFLCYRGSINWTFNCNNPTYPVKSIRVNKLNTNTLAIGYGTSKYVCTYPGSASYNTMKDCAAGLAGSALTNGETNAGLNVQVPNYTMSKFQYSNPANANKGTQVDGSLYDCCELKLTYKREAAAAASEILVDIYVSAGTDFSVYFFLNVPTFYYYSAIPTPA